MKKHELIRICFLCLTLAGTARASAEPPFLLDSVGVAAGVQRAVPADLDRDGDLDTVAAVTADGALRWWRNDDGTWSEETIDAAFPGVDSVVVFDVDRDGDDDVVAASSTADAVSWWRNDGTAGGWEEESIDGAFDGVSSLGVGDLDGDGDLDLVGTGFDAGDVIWWRYDGPGSWSRFTIDDAFIGARWAKAADLDSDGDLDVAALSALGDGVAWWENTSGDGQGWNRQIIDDTFSSGAFLATGDIDRDGHLDLLGAAFGGDEAVWWENIDASTWVRHSIAVVDGARSAEPGDLDGDGDLDVLIAANEGDRLGWWENIDGAGQAWTERTLDAAVDGPSSAIVADLDHDGDLDVLGAAAQGNEIFWWRNVGVHGVDLPRGSGGIVIPVPFTDLEPGSSQPGDLDGDGDTDLVHPIQNRRITWLENTDGAGGAWEEHLVDPVSGGTSLFTSLTDLDRDGDLDIVARVGNSPLQALFWYENEGQSRFWTRRVIETSTGTEAFLPTDLDGDGDEDLIGYAGAFAGFFQWWENVGGDDTTWPLRIVGEGTMPTAKDVAVGDIDRDGDTDVLIVEAPPFFGTPSAISWWRQDSGGSFERIVLPGPVGDRVALADIDNDGDLDAISGDFDFFGFQNLYIWANDGLGGWAFQVDVPIGLGTAAPDLFEVIDVNRDGHPDIAAAEIWLRNPKDGSADWAIAPFCRSNCEKTGDFNGDGRTDFLITLQALESLEIRFSDRIELTLRDPILFAGALVTERTPIWALDFTNLGAVSDPDLRLETLAFSFLKDDVQLTPAEVEARFSELGLVRDDGSGFYEEALDTEILQISPPFGFQDGAVILPIPETAEAAAGAGAPAVRFFVTATGPIDAMPTSETLTVSHLQELARAVTLGQGAEAELLNPTMAAAPIVIPGLNIFADDFETGNTLLWTLTVP